MRDGIRSLDPSPGCRGCRGDPRGWLGTAVPMGASKKTLAGCKEYVSAVVISSGAGSTDIRIECVTLWPGVLG